MYAHNSDAQLEADVRAFIHRHAPDFASDMKVQIVRGTFKKAHVSLSAPMPRELVHQLNTFMFNENGKEHRICVEDAAGSPEQKCPKFIAKYCRGHNLRFTHPCWCWHPRRETDNARYALEPISLDGAKGNEIVDNFMSSGSFHNGIPQVVAINAINNSTLTKLHDEYRAYLATKHREEPKVRELYHGTNNNIHDVLFQHGLQPPSDVQASEMCPVSGGKGLCTTLCNNDCKHCTEKHEWNRCHMFGLGIYLADTAQKSHRYVSQPQQSAGRRCYKMIVCSVLGRAFKVQGHLRCAEAMHDVPNVRSLSADEADKMIEPCCMPEAAIAKRGIGALIQGTDGESWGRVVSDTPDVWRLASGRIAKKKTEGIRWNWETEVDEPDGKVGQMSIDIPAEKSDMIFVQGLGANARPGWSVVNSEYIAFHPHQCLPKYEITYVI